MKAPEGVAAPLEPSAKMLDEMVRDFCSLAKFKVKSEVRRRIEDYAAQVSKNGTLIKQEWRDLCKRNEENCFKALDRIRELEAVSKNLQEELALEIKRREHWQKLAESLYENASLNLTEMSRLEKEITALRETK